MEAEEEVFEEETQPSLAPTQDDDRELMDSIFLTSPSKKKKGRHDEESAQQDRSEEEEQLARAIALSEQTAKGEAEKTIDLTDEPGADTQEAMDMSEASANSLVSAEQDETGRSQFEEVQERAIKRGVVLLPYRTPPTQTQEGVKRTLLREPSIDGNGDSAAGLPAAGEDAGPINAATGGSLASSSTTPLMEVLESQEVEEVLESQELQEAQF